MIDLHCHILPEIDDGAQTVDEALQMAWHAARDGITDMICTPHSYDGMYRNPLEDVLRDVHRFQDLLKKRRIPLRVHPGTEIHIHPDLVDHVMNFQALTCNQTHYVLVELPAHHIPTYTDDVLYEMKGNGLVPVIAHPERNVVLHENPEILAEWIEKGAIAQLTAGCLTGEKGERLRAVAEDMIQNHLVHVIATDAHNMTKRRPELREAYDRISQRFSFEEAKRFMYNSHAVLKGKECVVDPPVVTPKKKKWVIF
ncbi:protein-tyrosine phosphatase [Melghirimyces profundicolus]|uniref:Tyrosine-protein phosphatase n=1 Tax=Melghirimyces profundicolus TaxID=1242148 RepID=A0A2T6BCD7_9BACL|nr:CpsB/CapC family capsule biosynthesis tyrosine phosphatase [Melghirimyces profundicolus]PTX53727.1 protein-tyrosine phosphatase [Melghirimyces profundicolus]